MNVQYKVYIDYKYEVEILREEIKECRKEQDVIIFLVLFMVFILMRNIMKTKKFMKIL